MSSAGAGNLQPTSPLPTTVEVPATKGEGIVNPLRPPPPTWRVPPRGNHPPPPEEGETICGDETICGPGDSRAREIVLSGEKGDDV